MASYPDEVLADSPLGYWRLGDDFNDSSGNGRHFSAPNPPTTNQGSLLGSGDGNSKLFNGVNHYITIPDAAWMEVSALTVEARVKTLASGGGYTLSRWGSGATNETFLFNAGATSVNATLKIAGTNRTVTQVGTLTAGTIHTVTVTFDGTDLKLYIDGALNTTGNFPGALRTTANAPLEIGRAAGSAFSANHVAEVSFTGTALSAGRIATRHAAAEAPSSTAITGALSAVLPW